jgi:hypothetical protein
MAEPFVQQSAKGAPYSGEVQLHLAAVLTALGRATDAAIALDRALTIDKGLAERTEVKRLLATLPR